MARHHRLASSQQYAVAFEEIARRRMAESRRTMLLAHYAMPGHIATMRHLAATVGHTSSHGFANVQYGGLAGQVYRELHLRFRGIKLWTLATWPEDPIDELAEFSFRMRPEVARALEQLGWTNRLPEVPSVTRIPFRTIEGEQIEQLRLHRKRERGLREAKIADASARSADGRLRCEVPGCGFDFESRYGQLGRGYIQVHHLRPLGTRDAPEHTALEELILICANCHVMIHRDSQNRSPDGILRR